MVSKTDESTFQTLIETAFASVSPIVVAIRAALPSILAIHDFGSCINGTVIANNDLDLAVQMTGYADPIKSSLRCLAA